MRNTMMLNGKYTQEEMIKSVDKGIFAVSFGGGQVDITSGKFVFNCTEAYEIINGKIGAPIKGATLIGDGPSILKEVSLVGNNMMLDPGIGTCGKAGQGVPVGVAQPSILIDKMTVGGTQL
jgi:TldD protein